MASAEPAAKVDGRSTALTPEGRRRRSRMAVNQRHHPDRPDLQEDDRRWLKNAAAEAYIRKLVDGFPELTDAQRRKLAALLHPEGGGDASPT